MNEKIKLKHTCYVLLQIDKNHPIVERRFDLIWYPERSMSLLDCVKYRPYVKSIVTENPWIIGCYSKEHVRVWNKEYGWVRPNNETYGGSVNGIMMSILGIRQTIPSTPLDGGDAINALILKLQEERP